LTEYFVNATVWSALGFVAGIIVGTGIRIQFLGKALDARGRDRLLGAALISIALVSTIQSLAFQRQQRSITDCQSRYNEQYQAALQERAKNADRDRNNTNEMVRSVLSAPDRTTSRSALEKYIQVNDRLAQQRQGLKLPTSTGADCEREK
jgi:hypothetical protein